MTNLTLLVAMLLGAPQVECGGDGIGRLVRDNLFNETVRLDRAADAAWTACATPGALAARQAKVRAATIAAIGGFPDKTPLNARTVGAVQKDGFAIEKIIFESRPGHYVTAHLFLPSAPGFKPPYPGVVSPCGHSLAGKNAPWYQRVGVTGAKVGISSVSSARQIRRRSSSFSLPACRPAKYRVTCTAPKTSSVRDRSRRSRSRFFIAVSS